MQQQTQKKQPQPEKVSRSKRSGTVISVPYIEKYLRDANVKPRLEATCSVVDAAIVEEIFGNLVQDSFNVMVANSDKTLTERHIMHAIENDSVLKKLFPGVIPGAGVVSHIHTVLLPIEIQKKLRKEREAKKARLLGAEGGPKRIKKSTYCVEVTPSLSSSSSSSSSSSLSSSSSKSHAVVDI